MTERNFARGLIGLGHVLLWGFMAAMGLVWLLCLSWASLSTIVGTAVIAAFCFLGLPALIVVAETLGRWAKDPDELSVERRDAPPKYR